MEILVEVTILEKLGQFAAISKVIMPQAALGQHQGMVAIYDDRVRGKLMRQSFESGAEADGNYQKAIKTSTGRGWERVFRGTPNNAALS